MRDDGSSWVNILDGDFTLVAGWLVTPIYRGGGILRAVIGSDGNAIGTAATTLYDATLTSSRVVPAVAGLPSYGTPLFIAGPASTPGYGPVTDLQLGFTEGLVLVFPTLNVGQALIVFDPW